MVPEREYGVEAIVEKRCRILFIEKEEEWDGINMMGKEKLQDSRRRKKAAEKSNDVRSDSAKLPLHDSDSAGSGIAKTSKGTSYLRAVLARLLNYQFLRFASLRIQLLSIPSINSISENRPQNQLKMPDAAQINRSISTIRTELEFLQASNVLSGPQFQSILAQLPV
jgi:hypothetical protein